GLNETPVFQGDYTNTLLGYVICPRKSFYCAELTGEEVDALMKDFIDVREDGKNPIIHENIVPVTAGFSHKIKNNGDGSFTYVGSGLEKEKTYKVLLMGNLTVIEDKAFAGTPINAELKEKLGSINVLANVTLANIVKNGGGFAEATPYLTWI
ncbi:MAG: hypothetical protein ACI4S4_05255, partial [Candidatus Ornithospirochaeta sp.]